MPKRFPEQMTFESGELSPFLYGRTDLTGYASSVKTALNMLPDQRGAIKARRGFEFNRDLVDAADRDVRLFTFRQDYTKTFVVAVSATEVFVSDKNGVVGDGPGGANLVTNPSFDSGATGWDDDSIGEGYVEYVDRTARLVSGASGDQNFDSDIGEIHQEITGLTPGNNHRLQFDTSLITQDQGQFQLRVGSTRGDNDIVSQNLSFGSTTVEFTPGVATIHLAWRVKPRIEVGPPTPEGDPTFIKRSVTVSLDNVNLFDLAAAPPADPPTFVSPYSADQLRDLQVAMAPDLQVMYFAHRDVPVHKLSVDISVNPIQWTFEQVTFTHTTDPWTTEFPGAITFHQGRLCLGGTVSEPVGIWLSKAGKDNYEDFTDPTGNNPVESFFVVLAQNADIQWLQGGKILTIGTDGGEHVVTASGEVVTSDDVYTYQVSAHGSSRVKSNLVSKHFMFVTQDRQRIRIGSLIRDTVLLETENVCWQSNHIFLSGIYEVHIARNPDEQLWAVLGDGTLAVCTYLPEFNISAWARVKLNNGTFKSLTVLEEGGRSVVYAAILRGNRLRLVRLTDSLIFQDEFVERSYTTATNTVDGLEHLEGLTVQVWGDNFVYPDAVVSGGQVTVVGPASFSFVVGLEIQHKVETIFTEIYGGGLSTAGMKKAWNRIGLRVIESAMPLINGSRPPSRVPFDPQNEAPPPFTGRFVVSNTGIDDQGTITVEQNLPLNLIISAMYGDLSEENI